MRYICNGPFHNPIAIGIAYAQNGQEGRFALKNMRRLRKTVRLAQEMGEGLGCGAILFGSLPQSAIAAHRRMIAPQRSCALNGNGAGYKVRTRDPLITNQVLYQLS
jgi:hypothetical protein